VRTPELAAVGIDGSPASLAGRRMGNATGRAFSRRHALGLAGLGAVYLAAGCTSVRTERGRLRPAAGGQSLREPQVIDSRAGTLEVELVAAAGVELAGLATSALGFNGSSPGPTLRVRPGDRLRVRLVNRLDQPTNLHTHGLRVSPAGNADNPFVAVEPGQTFDYLIDIPADHPAGTFWYHPHHHGTAADQVFGGLVGALVVDRGPEMPVERDLIAVVTDTTLLADGSVAAVGHMDRMAGRHGELVLVNGQHRPSIAAAPGMAQRWRIVNACASRVLSLRLAGHRLTQVAADGVFLPAPTTGDRVLLAPGNRADLVIRPEATGRFELVADPYDAGGMPMGGASAPVTLATLAVDGPAGRSAALPTELPAEPMAEGPVAARRRLTLATGMGMGMGGMSFTIDGRTFDPDRDDQTVRLGTVEEWDIVNSSPMAHPFHLHTWPFTVIADSAGGTPTGTAQDVVLVPPQSWVRLRIAFTAHPGRSVYHCHVLDHEDAGMMATIAVHA